ncbi:hypothetical protein QBC36DRAFT_372948, partial [Triangularia setosa]
MDQIRENQGVLPLGDFRKCSSAHKLFEFLGRAFPVKVNKQRTLNSFVIWLIERLIDKDVSDPSSTESELKEWYQLLKSCRIDDKSIIDGYVQLERDHVSEHPLDARRLHIFEKELRALMEIPAPSSQVPGQAPPAHDSSKVSLFKEKVHYTQPDRSLSVQNAQGSSITSSRPMDDYMHPDRRASVPKVIYSSTTAASNLMDDYIHPDRRVRSLVSIAQDSSKHTAEVIFGQMHPDRIPSAHPSPSAPEVLFGHMHSGRIKVSRDSVPEPGELIEEDVQVIKGNWIGTGRQGKSNKSHPPWLDVPYLSGGNAMALKAVAKEKEAWERGQKNLGKQKELDLSFLTGSNRMVFDNDWALTRKRKKAMQTEQALHYGENPNDTGAAKSTTEGGKESIVPGNYVCNRCHVRGHLIQDCPTNGDKRFAVKAPADYTCNFCGKHADHYIDDCSRRPSKSLRNLQVEQGSPRRVVNDSIRYSYRSEPNVHKRHHSGDSDIEEVDSSVWRSHPRRKRGRGSRRLDDEPDSALSIRGKAGKNGNPWGESTHVVLGYLDPDKSTGAEPPAKVYTSRRHLPISPDPREEGRLSYYDVPPEEVQSKESLSEKITLLQKMQRAVPKIKRPPVRVTGAPPRIRVDIREVSQMIDEEKIKDDLIPSFIKLLLGKEVHRRAQGKRPVATDLIEMPSESEDGDDDAMEVDEAPSSVKREQGHASAELMSHPFFGATMNASAQAANVSVIQHLHGVIDVGDDTVMTEARPSVIVSGLGDTTDLTELSDDDSESDAVVVDG